MNSGFLMRYEPVEGLQWYKLQIIKVKETTHHNILYINPFYISQIKSTHANQNPSLKLSSVGTQALELELLLMEKSYKYCLLLNTIDDRISALLSWGR